jgi:hypothetical protein
MQTVRLDKVKKPIREFLEHALAGDGFIVEDADGRRQGAFYSDQRYSPAEQEAALQRLQRLQRHSRQAMEAQGVTEDDIDRVLQADA